jgi:hypothetical protein
VLETLHSVAPTTNGKDQGEVDGFSTLALLHSDPLNLSPVILSDTWAPPLPHYFEPCSRTVASLDTARHSQTPLFLAMYMYVCVYIYPYIYIYMCFLRSWQPGLLHGHSSSLSDPTHHHFTGSLKTPTSRKTRTDI